MKRNANNAARLPRRGSAKKAKKLQGKLTLLLGSMGSGKTNHLVASLNRLADLDYPCLLLNSDKDIRSDSIVSTNSKGNLEVRCDQLKVPSLLEVDVSRYHSIGVDEGQFFDDIPEAVRRWLTLGKQIFVAGLDGDYRQKPFGRILELVPLCSPGCLHKLIALCMVCRRQGFETDAGYTKRIAKSDGVIDIGGTDKYQAVCWRHL